MIHYGLEGKVRKYIQKNTQGLATKLAKTCLKIITDFLKLKRNESALKNMFNLLHFRCIQCSDVWSERRRTQPSEEDTARRNAPPTHDESTWHCRKWIGEVGKLMVLQLHSCSFFSSSGSPMLRDTMRPADSNSFASPTSSLKATTREEQKTALKDLLSERVGLDTKKRLAVAYCFSEKHVRRPSDAEIKGEERRENGEYGGSDRVFGEERRRRRETREFWSISKGRYGEREGADGGSGEGDGDGRIETVEHVQGADGTQGCTGTRC